MPWVPKHPLRCFWVPLRRRQQCKSTFFFYSNTKTTNMLPCLGSLCRLAVRCCTSSTCTCWAAIISGCFVKASTCTLSSWWLCLQRSSICTGTTCSAGVSLTFDQKSVFSSYVLYATGFFHAFLTCQWNKSARQNPIYTLHFPRMHLILLQFFNLGRLTALLALLSLSAVLLFTLFQTEIMCAVCHKLAMELNGWSSLQIKG